MRLWNYCAICGKRIEVGDLCIGVEENSEIFGDSICIDCAKIENLPDGEDHVSIADLLARAEAAEARCKRLNEARERANEACAKWEYKAEKAERERDAAVSDLEIVMAYGGGNLDTCQFCKNGQCYARGGTKPCLPKWRVQKEE